MQATGVARIQRRARAGRGGLRTNSVWINGKVVMPAGFPETQAAVERLGYQVLPVDTFEFRKLDGGVSCLSLRF